MRTPLGSSVRDARKDSAKGGSGLHWEASNPHLARVLLDRIFNIFQILVNPFIILGTNIFFGTSVPASLILEVRQLQNKIDLQELA